MKHLNIEVFGIVQGVSFRYHTREKAQRLGIKGFVRNRTDGSVYIESEGEEVSLKAFVEWCQHGPSFARVDRVLTSESALHHFNTFEVRY